MTTPAIRARKSFALGDVRVEPERNLLAGPDGEVRIEPKVMDVLCVLAEADGEVVAREKLIERVWAVDFGGDESVSRAISLLRRALKDAGLDRDPIETVPKRGYRLTIASSDAPEAAAAPEPGDEVDTGALETAAHARKIRAIDGVLFAALIIGLAAFAAIAFIRFKDSAHGAYPVVAVLPFDDLSPGGDYEWFAEGLADELIDNLARAEDIVVIGRTSSFQYGNSDLDARAIGSRLGARYLIEGGVRRDGERLRVSASIVDTRNQATLWSDTFDRTNEDVFKVQAELARAIVHALNARMFVENPEHLIGTKNPAAFDAFLLGRAYFRAEGAENILRATEQFRRATRIDPGYLDAWFGLQAALAVYDFWHPDKLKDAMAERNAAIESALKIMPDNKDLQVMKAWSDATQGDMIGADRAFNKLFNGQRPDGCSDLAFISIVLYGRIQGDFAKCFENLSERDLDDLATVENNQFLTHLIGRDDISRSEYERSKKIPGGPGTGEIYAFLRAFNAGDREQARAHFRGMIDFLPAKVAQFEAVYENFNDDARVREILNEARLDPANQDPTRLVMIAKLLAVYGDPEGAADALRRHFLDAGGTWWQELWMPEHAATRRQAAFRDIIRKMGFEAYFRASGKWNDFCRPLNDSDFECY